jgi:hypothetical protein
VSRLLVGVLEEPLVVRLGAEKSEFHDRVLPNASGDTEIGTALSTRPET